MGELTKRDVLSASLLAAVGLPALAETAQAAHHTTAHRLPMATGRFSPTAESLKTYQTPEWFRDAKFGIWAH